MPDNLDNLMFSAVANQIEAKPMVIFNNNSVNLKNILLNELNECDEFKFSVSFIKMSGLNFLLPILEQLDKNNVPGKILTTDYMYVTEPNALRRLNDFENIEVKVYPQSISGFHIKSYIFKKEDLKTVIIGSSNISGAALVDNKEWNLKIQIMDENQVSLDIENEFDELWSKSHPVDEIIDEYQRLFSKVKDVVFKFENINDIEDSDEIHPNRMQCEFISNLENLINNNEKKRTFSICNWDRENICCRFSF